MSVVNKIKLDYKDKPDNLHFSTMWRGQVQIPYNHEVMDYLKTINTFLCKAVSYIRVKYNVTEDITVKPSNRQVADYHNGEHILYLYRLNNFKENLGIKYFDSSNSEHCLNLLTGICHELGHIIFKDTKYKHFWDTVLLPQPFLLVVTLSETRADIYARILMEHYGLKAHYKWMQKNAEPLKSGYFDRETRSSFAEYNDKLDENAKITMGKIKFTYNKETIENVLKELNNLYGEFPPELLKDTTNYIKKKYKNDSLKYFEILFKKPFTKS